MLVKQRALKFAAVLDSLRFIASQSSPALQIKLTPDEKKVKIPTVISNLRMCLVVRIYYRTPIRDTVSLYFPQGYIETINYEKVF